MKDEFDVLDFDDEGVLRVEPQHEAQLDLGAERRGRVGLPDLNLPMASGWLTSRAA